MTPKKKLIWLFSLTATLLIFSTILPTQAQHRSKDPDIRKRQEMVDISRQLGVTCTHCHDTKNLKDGRKKEYKIAFKHIQITKDLNSKKGFAGKPEVTCYLCHRGKAKPDYKEPEFKKSI